MSILASISDFFQNAYTGNLTQAQTDAIHASERADIAKAANGLQPAVVAEIQARAANELDHFLLGTDQGPQGTGSGTGLRVPVLGVVGTADFYAKLNSYVQGVILLGLLGGAIWTANKFGLFEALFKSRKHGRRG
jgi:hypothetical protein